MPLVLKRLGYTLAPGERFTGEDEAVDEGLENYAKSEINRKEGTLEKIIVPASYKRQLAPSNNNLEILSKLGQMECERGKGNNEDNGKLEGRDDKKLKSFLDNLTIVGELCCDYNVDQKKLEFHLKELATSFVKQGLNQLSDLMVTFNRPDDFYAEMIKSDEHMSRIIKALEARNNELTKQAVATIGKRAKKSIGKLSKKQYQLQQKNQFIKKVNVLKKKHKGGDIDKYLDELISDVGAPRRRGRPKGSKNKTTKATAAKAAGSTGASKTYKKSKKATAKGKRGRPRGRKKKSESAGSDKAIKKGKRGRPRKSDVEKRKGHKRPKT
ncbi:uncharacterized protein TOT_010000526 [Theileria orientalis strain Shintoku]|uniref:rRNA processing protein n=1 Tax=Theileria orientalis strain Shintoku TaxID=869250 RepID=J4C7H8_THEOR|nr:uncharacterized protein TOT_010000526 [Theileria orientalis strain Shintoku]BAM39063.1 uncharacterized protein TOT_010000526 [Theileria orientalis strain Shintoku]|eukprot:XP_009689364.1 uncharacterized protein TOT_010000526 [Theileria orientalis strain Shintoku]